MKCVNIGIFQFHLQFFFAIILTSKFFFANTLKTNGNKLICCVKQIEQTKNIKKFDWQF